MLSHEQVDLQDEEAFSETQQMGCMEIDMAYFKDQTLNLSFNLISGQEYIGWDIHCSAVYDYIQNNIRVNFHAARVHVQPVIPLHNTMY